jgi:hypothetical protein
MHQGPNVRKLIVHKMALLMIPPGTPDPLVKGVAELTSPGNLSAKARQATEWVEAVIAAIKAAPDNTYRTDEEIAAAILHKVEERQKAQRARNNHNQHKGGI